MKWRTGFAKVKHSLGRAYETSQKVLSVTDRAHALLAKAHNALGSQFEPEVRERVGGALQGYSKRRQQIANVDANLREISGNLRQAFPDYLGS